MQSFKTVLDSINMFLKSLFNIKFLKQIKKFLKEHPDHSTVFLPMLRTYPYISIIALYATNNVEH